MCGRDGPVFKAEIEGTELNVCKICSKYGKVVRPTRKPFKSRPKPAKKIERIQKEQSEELIIENYAKLIKNKRERLNLTQEKLAKKINEKESLLQKVESGHIKPSFRLAKKLQNFLKIKIIEEFKTQKKIIAQKANSAPLTIGDLINFKKI